MALILVLLTSVSLIANWLINVTFIEDYYAYSKQEDLIEVYEYISDIIKAEVSLTNVEYRDLVTRCEDKSISAIVIDASRGPKFTAGYNGVGDRLLNRLLEILFITDVETVEVIEEENNYTLQKFWDSSNNTNYLEIWGSLESGDVFMLRTSVGSIKGIVNLTSKFYVYVGSSIIILSGVIMVIVSMSVTKRIKALTNISNELTMLNFSAKYKDEGNDEISQLGKNVNILSETLEGTISKLKSANVKLQRDIEQKIEIDEMRKEFLSNVSHELKTPIAIIQGYAEGLKESVNDDAESKDFYCEVIIDEAQKMNKMVKNLLALNQIEFGNEKVTMERFDIITVIDQLLNKMEMLLKEKNAKVMLNNKEEIFVWADEFQIEQVITNYLSNAINHLDYENIIRINIEEKEDIIRCKMFNSGNSIPIEELENIWIKFHKVDKARTREYGGNGIGLSIVKAIMDSMNMKCGVENVDGGVEFWFEVEKAQKTENIKN